MRSKLTNKLTNLNFKKLKTKKKNTELRLAKRCHCIYKICSISLH